MSETEKKTAWSAIATEALEVESDLAPIQFRLDETAARVLVGEAPNEVYEALVRAEEAVGEARSALRRMAHKLETGEYREPCSTPGCDDNQENRCGLCYKHRQEAAEDDDE